MNRTTLYWLLFGVLTFILMFILVPAKERSRLVPFGLLMGLVQAAIVLWLCQTFLKFFRVVADPTILGIPVIASLSWIPPAIVFAYFLPKVGKTLLSKGVYVSLFALGTSVVQYVFSLIGMWESYRWNPVHTFFLAVLTHSIMLFYWHVYYRRRVMD